VPHFTLLYASFFFNWLRNGSTKDTAPISRYDPLPQDVRTVVRGVVARGLLPKAVVEQMIPESRLQLTEASSGKKCITRTVSAPSEQS
jgi:hypothetical protein